MQVQLKPWGNSQGIYIPKAALKQAGLEVNDPVDISVEGGVIMIKKDTSMDERRRAWESIKELREKIRGKDIAISDDYKREVEAYLDEKYGR